jgi:hypothetical protein
MERELAQALKNSVKEQVLNGLVEANQIDLPKAAVAQEIDTLRQQALQRFGGFQGGNAPSCRPSCSRPRPSAVSALVCCWVTSSAPTRSRLTTPV